MELKEYSEKQKESAKGILEIIRDSRLNRDETLKSLQLRALNDINGVLLLIAERIELLAEVLSAGK